MKNIRSKQQIDKIERYYILSNEINKMKKELEIIRQELLNKYQADTEVKAGIYLIKISEVQKMIMDDELFKKEHPSINLEDYKVKPSKSMRMNIKKF